MCPKFSFPVKFIFNSTRCSKAKVCFLICGFALFHICVTVSDLFVRLNEVRSLAYSAIANSELRENDNTEIGPEVAHMKKILFYNDYFNGAPEYWFSKGQEAFLHFQCPIDTCYLTTDRKLFSAKQLDAVLWHGRSLDRSLPSERYPHTRYIFYLMESPHYSFLNSKKFGGVFNYTFTYRRDSDIYLPYGYFLKKKSPSNVTIGKNVAAGKTKMAAWFVSHCPSTSKREILVENLQRYIDVDIYGWCGPLDCSQENRSSCHKMLEKDYKFYLAFENSLCLDYVTEKFFQISKLNIIPVVYGMAEYSELAPPKSFINVLDFKDVKELAEYLIYLSNNDTAYNEYFKWKDYYDVMGAEQSKFCDLCAKLHADNGTKVYRNLYDWYEKDKCVQGGHQIVGSGSGPYKQMFDIAYYNAWKAIFE